MDESTLREMARVTLLTNKLNDIQLKTLQMWPFVLFDNVKEVKLEYDLSNTKYQPHNDMELNCKGTIKYFIDGDIVNEKVEILKQWVGSLFWSDIALSVEKINNI